jgi:adenosylhomocysteinase
MDFDIKNVDLAPGGRHRIEWAEQEMPVLRGVQNQFRDERPFAGLRVSGCMHVTTETANLMVACKRAGPMWFCAPATRSAPRTTWPPRW